MQELKEKNEDILLIEKLNIIENIVDRLSSYSKSVKEWSILITTALFALTQSVKVINKWHVLLIMCMINIIFCCLDNYYLFKEKSYRDLFTKIYENENYHFSLSIKNISKTNYFKCFRSGSIWIFYSALLILSITMYVIF